LAKAIISVTTVYKQAARFHVTRALMDGEFNATRGHLAEHQITLNTILRDEHVGDVEQYIQTLKERVCAMYNMLPLFTMIPPCLVIEMVKSSNFWLNSFPHLKGISRTMSPRDIVTGMKVDYNAHCKYEF
jgi:hypothetical protein